MRILLIVPELHLGGTERQVLLLARALDEAGHQARVLALRPARRPFPFDNGPDVITLNCPSLLGLKAFVCLLREIRRFRPEVVHTFLFGFDLPADAAARLCGVPCVVSSRREIAAWRRRRHLFLQGLSNRLVDAIVANSAAAAEYTALTEKGCRREKIHTVANAYAPRSASGLAAPLPRKGGACLLNVANFWPAKGHDILVRAFADVHAAAPSTALWLVGDGSEANAVQGLARRLGLEGAVHFLGARHDVDAILPEADLYVHASRTESSPNAMLEAMAAGVPVVAFACGGIPELLRGGRPGILVREGDAGELAAAIRGALDRLPELRRLAAEASEGVRRAFTPAAAAAGYLSVYRTAMRRRRGQARR